MKRKLFQSDKEANILLLETQFPTIFKLSQWKTGRFYRYCIHSAHSIINLYETLENQGIFCIFTKNFEILNKLMVLVVPVFCFKEELKLNFVSRLLKHNADL